jgi:hypothetical protein
MSSWWHYQRARGCGHLVHKSSLAIFFASRSVGQEPLSMHRLSMQHPVIWCASLAAIDTKRAFPCARRRAWRIGTVIMMMMMMMMTTMTYDNDDDDDVRAYFSLCAASSVAGRWKCAARLMVSFTVRNAYNASSCCHKTAESDQDEENDDDDDDDDEEEEEEEKEEEEEDDDRTTSSSLPPPPFLPPLHAPPAPFSPA